MRLATRLKMLAWAIAVAVSGGVATRLAGESAREAIQWGTAMVIGIIIGFWKAKL